jgi:FkbM family methyltransferase
MTQVLVLCLLSFARFGDRQGVVQDLQNEAFEAFDAFQSRPADWFDHFKRGLFSANNGNAYLLALAGMCTPPLNSKRLVLEVGGNKGYAIPRYNFIWGNLDVQLVMDTIKILQWKTIMWRENLLTVEVFEPTQSAINVLQHLVKHVPSLKGVNINHKGVSDEDGQATFYTPYTNVGDEGAHMGHTASLPEGGPTDTVQIVRLDTFMAQKYPGGFPGPIVFVKVDTEGFDAAVVRGMSKLLETHSVWAFQFEFINAWKDGRTKHPESIKVLGDWLSTLGYACYGWVHNGMTSGFIRWNGPAHWDDRVENTEFDAHCIYAELPCYTNFETAFGFFENGGGWKYDIEKIRAAW